MTEKELNYYYNTGKFNHPSKIGYVMNEIRECRPLTIHEWQNYYFQNVRSEQYIQSLANSMYAMIIKAEPDARVTVLECLAYIYDVMF